MPTKKFEITRSYSQKVKIGDYLTSDFFCSAKAEIDEAEKETKSAELNEFCYKEVLKSIKEYEDSKKQKEVEDWNEHKQELYDEGSKREDGLTSQ